MPEIHFTNLLIVTVAAFIAPFTLGLAPSVRLPAVVLEILLGIVIGPAGLGWVTIDEPIQVLSVVGLAFLLFSPAWRSTSTVCAARCCGWRVAGSCSRSHSRSSSPSGSTAPASCTCASRC